MEIIKNDSGYMFIDFKKSIITTESFEKVILIRWWITKFEKISFGDNCYYLYQKSVSGTEYYIMISFKNEKIFFECYYHNKETRRIGNIHKTSRVLYLLVEDVTTSSLDDVYKLYKKSLKLWEKHLEIIVIN